MLRLGALTRLRRLGLAGTSVKDAGLALIAPLAALETLSLEWCSRITDAGGQTFSLNEKGQRPAGVVCNWSSDLCYQHTSMRTQICVVSTIYDINSLLSWAAICSLPKELHPRGLPLVGS